MAPGSAEWLDALAGLSGSAQVEFFACHPDLRNPNSVEILHAEVLRVLYSDVARAERLALAACRLGNELGDPNGRAAGLRAMGHASYATARYEVAVGYYREALEILEGLGFDRETGRTLLSGLQPLIYLGRYDEAYEWAARAAAIFLELGDELRLARLQSNVGNILYRQDRYLEALAKYQDAYATLDRLGEPRDVAAVLSNIAVCQTSLNRFSQALETYRKARDYCQQQNLPALVAGADYNIAYLHYLQGDFLSAIELYKASRAHCRDAGDRYHAALCDLDEAEIHLELNLVAEAARLAGSAEISFLELGMGYEMGKAMVTHAIAASRRGRTREAHRLLGDARRLFTAEKNALWPALIDLFGAMLLEGENRDRQAAALCRRAYPVLSGSIFPSRAALAELLHCRLLLKASRVQAARRMAARAQARLEDAGTPWLRFHVYFIQGQVEEQAGDLARAIQFYRDASAEIETLRSRLWGDEPKISFLTDKLAVYESLVAARLSAPNSSRITTEEAFLCIQQAKSRSLADRISQAAPSFQMNRPPPGHDAEIETIRRHLDTQYRQMERLALSARTAPPAQLQALRQTVRDAEARLLRLLADSRVANETPVPKHASVNIGLLQASIPEGAVLLEYYVARGMLCVCVLDRSRLELVPLTLAADLESRIRLLRFQMRRVRLSLGASPAESRTLDDATACHLRDLYDQLVAPIESRLRSAKHLIVAPHGLLHHLPFHALLGPDGFTTDRFTVSYAPSATVFSLCEAREPRFNGQSLVFGLPDQLAPRIALEARTAAEMLPGARLFLGQRATEEVLRSEGPASRFIHIATHGLFRSDNPLFSAIRLGDSHLSLLDLYGLPLSAELVTLSGCSTGLNVVVGGDELLGLIRGVLMAGAHAVMVSLWDINDSSTADFMKAFYSHLRAGGDKAEALRKAMRQIREQFPHPYYWAAFALAGKYSDDPVPTSH